MEIKQLEKSLIHPQKYSEINHITPYIYQLENQNKKLLILGSEHTNDPKNSQFNDFKKLFLEFKPEVVYVEGGWDKSDQIPKESLAIQKGEMAFIVFLAQKNNVKIESWEPGMKNEIEHLIKKYSKEELFAHFILRTVRQYNQYGKSKGYFSRQIMEIKKLTNWNNFSYSMANLKKIHKNIFGVEFKPDNWKLYNIPPYILKGDTAIGPSVLNHIARDEMIFRDSFAVKAILNEFTKHKRVLAIMGAGHAVVQEPVYREYFNKL